MKRSERFVPLLLILCLGVVYTATLLPGIGYSGDTTKFQYLGHVLDISNAPGYPLYLMLNHVMSLLPFGSLAYKANLFSALCAVGACLTLYTVRGAGVPNGSSRTSGNLSQYVSRR